MKCRFCETELTKDDKYCPHCGMKVEQRPIIENHITSRLSNFEQPNFERPNIKNNRNIIIWVILIAVLIILVVFQSTRSSKPKDDYNDDYWNQSDVPEKYDYKDLNGDFILEKGNDAIISNLNNGGYITDDGTSIYMVNDNGSISRFNKSMMNEEVLYTGVCSELQMSEGFLYFKDANTKYFYKMDVKTKQTTTVVEEDIYYPRVYGSTLYYQSDKDNESMYRRDLVTNESVKLNDEATYNIQLMGNKVYYTTTDAIKVLDVETSEVKVIKDKKAYDLICQEGTLYYIDSTSYSIYRVDLTDESYPTTRLNRETSMGLVVSGDQIYYLDSSDQVINMKTNGLDNQILNVEDTGDSLQIQGEYLFMQDYNYEWYRMDLNGENGEYVFSQSGGRYI